jgi:hypothetical protein
MSIDIIRLSEEQFQAFINDTLDGTGPCRLQTDLPFEALAHSTVLRNTRLFLLALEDHGATLTAAGRLNRKFIQLLLDRLHWEGSDADEVRDVCKAPNEQDFTPALYLHALLRLAGLARKEKGVLRPTQKGRSLLDEKRAGQLQSELFRTSFVRFSAPYLDGINMPDVFAPQISLILYLIGHFCREWREPEPLMNSVTLPARELMESRYPELPALSFESRVLRYLCWFGLMEKGKEAANDDWRQPYRYRKTGLYDKMLRFVVL